WLQRHVYITVGAQEQRHFGQDAANGDMLQENLYSRSRDVAGQGEWLGRREGVRLVRILQVLKQDAVHALGVMRAGWEQIYDQHVNAQVEGGKDLAGEFFNVPGAVLVGRGDDLKQGDEAVAADMANGQRTAKAQIHGIDGVATARSWRGLGEGHAARIRSRW